jgi:carboxylesterase type B
MAHGNVALCAEILQVRGHHQLPVMVFIHGGGWLAGDGSKYQPHYLLDKNVVLVTFNYRLGPLGKEHDNKISIRIKLQR